MTEIVYIIVPVAALVILITLCLTCWRVWAYQHRRQRVLITQRARTRPQRVPAPAVARVVRVERCITDDGSFAQRTSYAVNQAGQPPRQFQRTIIIRPADNRRPDDPNLPPSYDMAVTGEDESVTVERAGVTQAPPTSGAAQVPPTIPPPPSSQAPPTIPPPPPSQAPPTIPPPPIQSMPPPSHAGPESSSRSFSPPAYSSVPRAPSPTNEDEDITTDDRARLLP